MKTKLVCLFSLIFILCFSVFVQASVDTGNLSHEILGYYGSGAQITGWMNVSIENEDSNALVKDYFGSSIGLLSLIKNISGLDYSCVPIDCRTRYSASTPAISKTMQITAGSSSVIGFKIEGEIQKINSINFVLKSSAGESCESQVEMDFFIDNNIEFSNNKSSSSNCPTKTTYGCFETSSSTTEYSISAVTPYCQRIILPEGPKFEVGAWVKKVTGNMDLKMWLHNEYGDPISEANCDLPSASTSGGEISCAINYLVKESKEYFVCLDPGTELTGDYKVRGYGSSDSLCGFHSAPSHNAQSTAAYQIFAKTKKFAPIGTVNVNDVIGVDETLSARASDYLVKKYGSAPTTCPTDGCIIPIKIISNVNQKVDLQNLNLVYEQVQGGVTTNNFFAITESVAKVSTNGFQKFILDKANFLVSSAIGKVNYTVNISSTEIFKNEISIEAVSEIKGLSPSTTPFGYPTTFKIDVNASRNITSYFLDFGDGYNLTSIYNSMVHTYNASGSYAVTALVTDEEDRVAYKSFSILVSTPEVFIESVLNRSQVNLENVNAEISKYPAFFKKSLEDLSQVNFYEEELKKYKRELSQTYGDEGRLFTLTTKLLNFTVPKAIVLTKEAKGIAFYPQEENINLAYLVEASGGSEPSDSQKYIDGILGWNQETMNTKVDYTEFYIEAEGTSSHLVSFFEITLIKLKSDKKDPWLIMDQMNELEFESKSSVNTDNTNYVTAKLSGETTTILFSTTEDVDFITLPLFVSLPIDYVPLGAGNTGATDTKKPKWIILILVLVLLVIIGIAVYIFLQIWYKKKYETYLFPSKTDLYNLVSFIQTSRDKGISDREIRKKLSASAWSGEHIAYAMRKHAGKRTGMVEIPIGFGASKKNEVPKDKSISRARPKRRLSPQRRTSKKGLPKENKASFKK